MAIHAEQEPNTAAGQELFSERNEQPRSYIESLIDEWIIGKTNAYRDRYILKRRLIDGIPYCALEDIVERRFKQPITERQLRRIVSAGIKTLKRHGLK